MDRFTTSVEGMEIEYAEQGAQQPIVLVHGWGADKGVWRELWPQLKTRGRALAPDLPGWGRSDKPDAPYTPEWYGRWLRGFLDVRDVPAADVVAHSMGAMAAVMLAAEHPERVRRLVLVNPPVVGSEAFSARTYALARPGLRWITYQLLGLHAIRSWVARDFTYRMPLAEEDLDAVLQGSYDSMLRSVKGMIAADVRPQLASVRVPTLVIGTTHDGLIKPAQSELAASTIPHAQRVTIDACGHMPMLEKTAEFNGAVLDFLLAGGERRRPPGW
jgi:2-hydroxy-6-oxo-octa-2,4-dienoate hydrolase